MCKIFFAAFSLLVFAPLDGGAVMLVAARASFFISRAKRWTNPYVTDGLIAMWDGEWPSGVGGQSAQTASEWVDCINGGVYGRGTGIRYDATRRCFDTNKIGLSVSARFPFAALSSLGGITVEVVFAGTFATADYRGFVTIGEYNIIEVGTSSVRLRPAGSANTVSGIALNTTMSAVNTSASGTGRNKIYVNGVFRVQGNTPSLTVDYVSSPNQSANNVSGRLYAVRVYSRVLSAAEIAANYATDRARFNLS